MFPLLVALLSTVSASAESKYLIMGTAAPVYSIAADMGEVKLLLNPLNGSKEAALDHLDLKTGAVIAEHTHESAEIIYVETGMAQVQVGGSSFLARAGDAIYIPAGTKHSAKIPDSSGTFRAVQFYVGPGPEERFRKGQKLR